MKNTVVIYSSDQGFYLGDHGWFDKRFMYEESYRMPLMVRWPGVIKPGSVNSELVSNLDFAETFLDIAGTKPGKGMQGTSIKPLFSGATPKDWQKSLYYHYYEFFGNRRAAHMVRRHYGVRTKRYKYIRNLVEGEINEFKQKAETLDRDLAVAQALKTSVEVDPEVLKTFETQKLTVPRPGVYDLRGTITVDGVN